MPCPGSLLDDTFRHFWYLEGHRRRRQESCYLGIWHGHSHLVPVAFAHLIGWQEPKANQIQCCRFYISGGVSCRWLVCAGLNLAYSAILLHQQ